MGMGGNENNFMGMGGNRDSKSHSRTPLTKTKIFKIKASQISWSAESALSCSLLDEAYFSGTSSQFVSVTLTHRTYIPTSLHHYSQQQQQQQQHRVIRIVDYWCCSLATHTRVTSHITARSLDCWQNLCFCVEEVPENHRLKLFLIASKRE